MPDPPNPLGSGCHGKGSEPSEPSGFEILRGGFRTLWVWGATGRVPNPPNPLGSGCHGWGSAGRVRNPPNPRGATRRVPNPPNPLGSGCRGEGSQPSEPSGCHRKGSEPSEPSGFGVPRGGFRTLRTLWVWDATGRVPNPPNPPGSGCHGEGSEPSEPSLRVRRVRGRQPLTLQTLESSLSLTPSTPLFTPPLPMAVLPPATWCELGRGVKDLATVGVPGVEALGVPSPPVGRLCSTTVVTPDSLSGSVFNSGAASISEMLTSASAAGCAPAAVESERQPKVAVDSPESAIAKIGKRIEPPQPFSLVSL
jgi:hypothetical protein